MTTDIERSIVQRGTAKHGQDHEAGHVAWHRGRVAVLRLTPAGGSVIE